jgi:AraC family transcriptional regulator of adaptative response/methylated-DNA-[protein]-cysteine methyltransferase
VAQAIDYLRERAEQQPQLEEVADHIGLSPFHFQRLFTHWAGVSPKRFLQFLTVEHAKSLLHADSSVLAATYATGLSSPSRLHDLFVATEAVTPGEYKSGGAGIEIRYGFAETPFGKCLVATTSRGIVALAFVTDEDEASGALQGTWFGAALHRDDAVAEQVAGTAFASAAAPDAPLRLLLRGTNFQIRVWRALLDIPFGGVATYGSVAETVCTGDAARAVGNAVGANPIAYLIPCHRVIRAGGEVGGYRWGPRRKANMLGWEQARVVQQAAAENDGPRLGASGGG